jgi:hypothetical protein
MFTLMIVLAVLVVPVTLQAAEDEISSLLRQLSIHRSRRERSVLLSRPPVPPTLRSYWCRPSDSFRNGWRGIWAR